MKFSASFITLRPLSGLICLLFFQVAHVTAFECYQCTTNQNDVCSDDLTQYKDQLPSSVRRVQCEGYCTIVRTEYTDIPGEVVSLVRDCSPEEPLVKNDIRTDKLYTKMYTSCNINKCNSGDGKQGTPGSGSGRGPYGIIVVPESSSSLRQVASLFCVIVGVLLTFTFMEK